MSEGPLHGVDESSTHESGEAPQDGRTPTRLRLPNQVFVRGHRIVVRVDESVVYDGPFVSGLVIDLRLEPGAHTLRATLGFRSRTWPIQISATEASAGVEIEVAYDHLWGTFSKELATRVVAAFEPQFEPTLVPKVRSASGLTSAFAEGPPHAVFVLLGVLALVFLAEVVFGLSPTEVGLTPGIDTLVAFGGSTVQGVAGDGEWYRMIAGTFLHANLVHLALNGFALVMVGILLEGMLGARWLLALYFLGAVGGSVLSLVTNDENLVSVGASGAIMGLFAAGMVTTMVLPEPERTPIQMRLGRVLIPSLLPFLAHGGERIDYGAHLGGAMVGATAGAVVLAGMKRAQRRGQPFEAQGPATALSVVFIALSGYALLSVVFDAYPTARAEAETMALLVPDEEVDRVYGEDLAFLERALLRYPNDPRVHLAAAERAYDREAWPEFDHEVAVARSSLEQVRSVFAPDWPDLFLSDLATVEASAALYRQLVPNRDLPATGEEWSDDLERLLALYPNDPRVLEAAADAAGERSDAVAEETYATRGIEMSPRFAEFFDDMPWLWRLRWHRSMALLQLDRADEAQPLRDQVCADPSLAPEVRAAFVETGYCRPE